ncbi:methyltransferase [Sphingomonas sp. HMP9]|nr:methyltransferase [Sphingomonas sp. HMP9]
MPSSTTATRRARSRPAGVPSPWQMFFSGFLKHPVMVGSIVPSSDKLIRKMLGPVDWANCKLFVEYGPGVGTFCRPILDRMAPDAKLVVIDTNPEFIQYLRHTITDPRFFAVLGSADEVETIVADHGFEKADYVLSGLPFSTLPQASARRSRRRPIRFCGPAARSWSISSRRR